MVWYIGTQITMYKDYCGNPELLWDYRITVVILNPIGLD